MSRYRFLLTALVAVIGACRESSSPADTTTVVPVPAMQILGSGSVIVPPWVAEVAVTGTTAYTTTWSGGAQALGNRVDIWDVSGDTPLRVDSLVIQDSVLTTGDVSVTDDGQIMIVATERDPGRIFIYDISNPRMPEQLSMFRSDNTRPGVHTAKLAHVDGKLYAFLSVDPGSGFRARLVIVDLSDPATPKEVYVRLADQPTYVHDTFVRDGVLFIAEWTDGLIILDVGGLARGGTITSPVEVGRIVTKDRHVHNVWWFHDPSTGAKRYAFVGEENQASLFNFTSGDVHVVDLVDPAQPREVAFYSGGAGVGTHNFWMDESAGILYAAYYNGGVRAIDVRGDLSVCTESQRDVLGRCNLGRMAREKGRGLQGEGDAPVFIWGVHYDNGAVFASDMLGKLWKLKGL